MYQNTNSVIGRTLDNLDPRLLEIGNIGSRIIIPQQKERYLQLSRKYGPLVQGAVRDILMTTQYIPADIILNKINSHLDEFLSENIQVSSLVDITKPSSDLWFLAYFWKKLRQFPLFDENIIHTSAFLNIPPAILILDDIIYSGGHIAGFIDSISYFLLQKGLTPPQDYYIVNAFTTEYGMMTINQIAQMHNVRVHFFTKMINIKSPFLTLTDQGVSYDQIRQLEILLGSEGTPFPIYTDYSVGKFQSSFPQVYTEGCIGNECVGSLIPPVDRTPINYVYNSIRKNF